jgi:hypothetical protein
MPNKDLKNSYFTPSDEVINTLKSALAKYQSGGDTKGLKRAKEIVDNRKISYGQMNRMKNYFETYEGEGMDDEYILNGGDVMKKWVNSALDNATGNIKAEKRTRMNAGEENQFIKTHTKDRDNADPTNVNLPKINKGSTMDNIMNNRTVYESLEDEIEGIVYLIEYMNNNKTKII